MIRHRHQPLRQLRHLPRVFTETKPPLDLPKMGGDEKEGKAEAAAAKVAQAGAFAAQAVARAAKLAGLSVGRWAARRLPTIPSKKLPSTFWSACATIAIESRAGHAAGAVPALPARRVRATVLFADENVGEFSYELAARPRCRRRSRRSPSRSEAAVVRHPRRSSCPSATRTSRRRGRLVLERSTREKERMGAALGQGAAAARPGAAAAYVRLASLLGPDDHRPRRQRAARRARRLAAAHGRRLDARLGRRLGRQHAARATGTVGAAGRPRAPTPTSCSCASCPTPGHVHVGAADALAARRAAVRPGGRVLGAGHEGVARLHHARAHAAAAGPAHCQQLRDADWSVSANLRGEGFSGPPSVKIGRRARPSLPARLHARLDGREGGRAHALQPEHGRQVRVHAQGRRRGAARRGQRRRRVRGARTPTPMAFSVFNVLGSRRGVRAARRLGPAARLGPATTVAVPARGQGREHRQHGRARRVHAQRVAAARRHDPRLGHLHRARRPLPVVHGRDARRAAAVRAKLDITAPLRKVVSVEIPISNPTDSELEFAVLISGEGLLGDESIRVDGRGDAPRTSCSSRRSSPARPPARSPLSTRRRASSGTSCRSRASRRRPSSCRCCAARSATFHDTRSPSPTRLARSCRCSCASTTRATSGSRGPRRRAARSCCRRMASSPRAHLHAVGARGDAVRRRSRSCTPSSASGSIRRAASATCPGDMPVDDAVGAARAHDRAARSASATPSTSRSPGLHLEQISMSRADDPSLRAVRAARAAHLQPYDPAVARRCSSPSRSSRATWARRTRRSCCTATTRAASLTWRFPIVGEADLAPRSTSRSTCTSPRASRSRASSPAAAGPRRRRARRAVHVRARPRRAVAALIEGSLTLTPLQRTLAGGTLVMAVDWRPLRPVRTSAALIVRKQSAAAGGTTWCSRRASRSPTTSSTSRRPSTRRRRCSSSCATPSTRTRPSRRTSRPTRRRSSRCRPGQGVLTRAGTAGTLFTVSYTPVEYGKPVSGSAARAAPADPPVPMATKVDHVLDPAISCSPRRSSATWGSRESEA